MDPFQLQILEDDTSTRDVAERCAVTPNTVSRLWRRKQEMGHWMKRGWVNPIAGLVFVCAANRSRLKLSGTDSLKAA